MFGGGAERVVLSLLNSLDRSKFELYLALVKREGSYLDLIPNDVKLIDLNVSKARYSIFKIYRVIKDINPDVVFTSLAHLNLLIALIRPLFGNKIKFIARESNTVSQNNKRDKYPKINDFLYKRVYKNYDLIITQAKAMRDDLRDNFYIDSNRMKIIYNPVDIKMVRKSSLKGDINLDKSKFNLLAVGRLSYQKGFDMLLRSIKELDDSYHLTIIGEGKEHQKLIDLAKELQIEKQVTFLGFCDNPYIYMKNADLLVLSSRYEGLPNVVLEANSLGTPVVAFNSSGGTGEIIEDGLNGFLVKPFDTKEFAKKIIQAREYDFNETKIKKYIKDRFDIDIVVKEYERVFSND
jgi:glycosyltransferase involved in cell wall biosynthesis